MTTKDGYLLAKGARATTSVDVNAPEQICTAVKYLFELAQQRPHEPGKTPVVFGAIPFAMDGKAQFILPRESQHLSRQQLLQLLSRGSSAQMLIPQSQFYKPGKAAYEDAVRQALHSFEAGELEKVVLGKQLHMGFTQEIDQTLVLLNLLQNSQRGYPFSLPLQEGTLLGVSPELLIRKQGTDVFTNPLAGSVKRQGQEKQEAWQAQALFGSAKDRHEHQLVVADIVRLLKPLCRELNVPEQPSVLKTDSMLHLSTEISGQLYQADLSSLDAALAIHPTPAVCGYPTHAAYEFIHQYEEDRGYFAGLVGWCDENGNGEWYIAIRSGMVKGNEITLFAGAGVVPGSEPEKEWQETDAKLCTMLKALMPDATASQEIKHASQI